MPLNKDDNPLTTASGRVSPVTRLRCPICLSAKLIVIFLIFALELYIDFVCLERLNKVSFLSCIASSSSSDSSPVIISSE